MILFAVKQMYRDIGKESKKMNEFVRLQPVADGYEVYLAKVREDAAIILDFKALSAMDMVCLLKTTKCVGISAVLQVRISAQIDTAVRMDVENIQVLDDPAAGFFNNETLRKMVPRDIVCFTQNDTTTAFYTGTKMTNGVSA